MGLIFTKMSMTSAEFRMPIHCREPNNFDLEKNILDLSYILLSFITISIFDTKY